MASFPSSTRKGQKTTLVVFDPCPDYEPPDGSHHHHHHHQQQQQQQQQHKVEQLPESHSSNEMELEMDLETECVEDREEQEKEKKQFDDNLPTIVLDCANIGWSFGKDHFSPEGVEIAFQFFTGFLCNVIGFLPASYYTRKPKDGSRTNPMMQTKSWDILDRLVRSDQLVIVPAGDSDDLYLLQYARMNKGFVVSNDFFADHVRSLPGGEHGQAAMQVKTWLDQYRSSYAFIKTNGRGTFMPSPASTMMEVLDSCRKNACGSSVHMDDDMDLDYL